MHLQKSRRFFFFGAKIFFRWQIVFLYFFLKKFPPPPHNLRINFFDNVRVLFANNRPFHLHSWPLCKNEIIKFWVKIKINITK